MFLALEGLMHHLEEIIPGFIIFFFFVPLSFVLVHRYHLESSIRGIRRTSTCTRRLGYLS